MRGRRVLLLDVMGTLVRDPFYDAVPRFFGTTLQALIADKHPTAWAEFEHGRIDEDELGRRFFVDGRAVDLVGLKRAMQDAYAWLPGIESLLGDLQAAGVEMHTLSNYPAWYRLIEDRLALSRFVRWTLVSCITGLRKPDASAFRHAVAALGVDPSQVLFVDDRADNCAGARACGIASIRFENADSLRRDLLSHDLLSHNVGRGRL